MPMSSTALPVLLLMQLFLMQLIMIAAGASNQHHHLVAALGDPAAALQQKIDTAIAARARSLSIPAGDYRFGNRTLLIQDATNLKAAGPVTIWFTNHDGGFVLRRCTNVSILGYGPGQPLRIDRSPPPWSQGTVTSTGSGSFEFTLDGDSADPRTMQPVGSNSGMLGPECTGWTKGSRAADHKDRPWSRGLPDSKAACFDNTKLTELGPRHFRALHGRGGGAGRRRPVCHVRLEGHDVRRCEQQLGAHTGPDDPRGVGHGDCGAGRRGRAPLPPRRPRAARAVHHFEQR